MAAYDSSAPVLEQRGRSELNGTHGTFVEYGMEPTPLTLDGDSGTVRGADAEEVLGDAAVVAPVLGRHGGQCQRHLGHVAGVGLHQGALGVLQS